MQKQLKQMDFLCRPLLTMWNRTQAGNGAKPFPVRAASALLRIPAGTIREVIRKVRNAKWCPIKPVERDMAHQTEILCPEAKLPSQRKTPLEVMRVLVREALYTASYGLPQRTFTDALCRLALNNVDVGDKYSSREFLETVESLAAKFIELQDSHAILMRMPALGVPSPIAVVFDGVTLGGGLFSRHETFEVVIANFVGENGKLETQLIGTPSPGLATDGAGLAQTVLRCLEQHEAVLNLEALRGRLLSIVGGDGAIIGGGPSARHSSSKAGEKLYSTVHPDCPEMIEWDQLHRLNSGWGSAMSQSSPAQELLAVAKALSQHFGHGHWRIIYRSVAEELGENVSAVDSVGGTRPLLIACRASRNLLRNFKVYAASFHAKIQRRQTGKGAQSQGSLTAIGRRLTSLDFVAFVTLWDDAVGRRMEPFSKLVQGSKQEPWVCHRGFERLISGLQADVVHLHALRKLIFVTNLLQHYLPQPDLAKFCRLVYSIISHMFVCFPWGLCDRTT